MKFIFIYLVLVNLFAIYVMYVDKKRSRKGHWRVPEKNLFIIAAVFGSLGILVGMRLFHHKTRHLKFVYGIPAILIIQLYLLYRILHFIK